MTDKDFKNRESLGLTHYADAMYFGYPVCARRLCGPFSQYWFRDEHNKPEGFPILAPDICLTKDVVYLTLRNKT